MLSHQQWLSACLLLGLLFTSVIEAFNKQQLKKQICDSFASDKQFIIGLGFLPDVYVLLTEANQMVELKDSPIAGSLHLDLNSTANVLELQEDISSWYRIVTVHTPNGQKYLIGLDASYEKALVLALGDSHVRRSVHPLSNVNNVEFGRVWLSSNVKQIFYGLNDQMIIKLRFGKVSSLDSATDRINIYREPLWPLWICLANRTHLTFHRNSCGNTDFFARVTAGLVIDHQVYLLTITSVYIFPFVNFENDGRDSVTVPYSKVSCEQFFGCSAAHTIVPTVTSSASANSRVIIPAVVVLVCVAVVALLLSCYYCCAGKSPKRDVEFNCKMASADQLKRSPASQLVVNSSYMNKFSPATRLIQEKQSGKMPLEVKPKSPLNVIKAAPKVDGDFKRRISKQKHHKDKVRLKKESHLRWR